MSKPGSQSMAGRVSHFFFLLAGFSCFGLAMWYFYIENRNTEFKFVGINILDPKISDDVPAVLAATGAAFIAIWAVIYSVHRADHRAHNDWVRGQLADFESWRTSTNGTLIANQRRLQSFIINHWIPPLGTTFPKLNQWSPSKISLQFLAAYRRAFPSEPFVLPRTLQEISSKMEEKDSSFREIRAIARRDKELALEIGVVSVTEENLQSWISDITNALAPVEDAIGRQHLESVDFYSVQSKIAMLDPMSELRWVRLAFLGNIENWIWLNLVATGSIASAHMRKLGQTQDQSWIEGLVYFYEANTDFVLFKDYDPLDSLMGDALWFGLISGYRRKSAMIEAFSKFTVSDIRDDDEEFAELAAKGEVALMRQTIGKAAADRFLEQPETPLVYDMPSYLGIKLDDF
jgi:hypothetical protein